MQSSEFIIYSHNKKIHFYQTYFIINQRISQNEIYFYAQMTY